MDARVPTSSGFFVSQEAPIHADNPVPTPTAAPPDIVRCAYLELVVTDLAASREFYVDVLNLVVTEEDENTVYLRSLEEFSRGRVDTRGMFAISAHACRLPAAHSARVIRPTIFSVVMRCSARGGCRSPGSARTCELRRMLLR